jgi:hypothetical protein
MKKISKFNQQFDQPLLFQENSEWVISRELYTKEEAFSLFKEEIDGWGQHTDGGSRWNKYTIDDITENLVRFCRQGDGYESDLAWWLDAKGKGSKPVWVLQLYMRPKGDEVVL